MPDGWRRSCLSSLNACSISDEAERTYCGQDRWRAWFIASGLERNRYRPSRRRTVRSLSRRRDEGEAFSGVHGLRFGSTDLDVDQYDRPRKVPPSWTAHRILSIFSTHRGIQCLLYATRGLTIARRFFASAERRIRQGNRSFASVLGSGFEAHGCRAPTSDAGSRVLDVSTERVLPLGLARAGSRNFFSTAGSIGRCVPWSVPTR